MKKIFDDKKYEQRKNTFNTPFTRLFLTNLINDFEVR